jgi:hypothetical protein
MATNTISGTIGTMTAGFEDQLWLIAPGALVVALAVWGLPKGVAFFKKLAK